MKNLIKIDLNQTVSKTEQKEKAIDQLRWGFFSFICICFLALIVSLSILIINVNNVIDDQKTLQSLIKKEINNLKASTADIEGFDSDRLLSINDIERLKTFQNDSRIFWGPKLSSLIDAISEDMVVTNMELVNRRFKMTVYTRSDSTSDAYSRGKELETNLRNSNFINHFKLNAKGEPFFSIEKFENDIIRDNKVHKIVFEGELEKTLNKKSRRKKRK